FPDSSVQILNGRYGPYVTNGAKNARIPKDQEPKSLSLADCEELLAKAPERRARGGKKTTSATKGAATGTADRARRAAKKVLAKKTTGKKASGKKIATKKAAGKKVTRKKAAVASEPAAGDVAKS